MLQFLSNLTAPHEADPNEELPWMQWDEFNDFFLNTLAKAPQEECVDTLKSYFGQSAEDFRLWLTLKDSTKDILLVLSPSGTNRDLGLLVYEDASLAHCLLSFFYSGSLMYGPIYNTNKHYRKDELKPLYSLFEHAMNRNSIINKAPDYLIPSKVKRESTAAQNHQKKVLEVSSSEWSSLLSLASSKKQYKLRTQLLRTKMFKNRDGTHKIWLHLNEDKSKKLLITLESTNDFISNTFSKNAIIPERPQKDTQFDMMYVYETNDTSEKKILIQFRISKGGEFAELVYIKSGLTVSGSELLTFLDQLSKSLGIQTILIQDDSRAPLYEDKEIPLRIIRPLTHVDRKTWYQNFGFELYPCKGIEDEKFISKKHPEAVHSHTYTQDLALYKKSLEKVCSTRVKDLLNLSEKKPKKVLKKIFKKYKLKDKNTTNTTLSELLTQLFLKTKDPLNSIRQKAQKRMFHFYENFLNEPTPSKSKAPGLMGDFEQAVSVLHGYRLFVKRTAPVPATLNVIENQGEKALPEAPLIVYTTIKH